MAASDKKNRAMGYDPLAWLAEEVESLVSEELNTEAETMPEAPAEDEILQQIEDNAENFSEGEIDHEDNEIGGSAMIAAAETQEQPDMSEVGASDESTVSLDATLSIQHVVKLHETLKKCYSANDAIEINASHVSSIDTATLQVLVALKKDAAKRNKQVVFVEPSRRFIESAELLGLLEILELDA